MTTPDWEQRLGGDVRVLRRHLRLTQVELAERANVSVSSVKYLESGRGSSLATFIRIARALERTEWLGAFAPPLPAVSPLALLRERQRTLADAARVRHPSARRT